MDAEIVSAQKGCNFPVNKRTPYKLEIKNIATIINIKLRIINLIYMFKMEIIVYN